MGRLSAASSPVRLRDLSATAVVGTDRSGGDAGAADALLTGAARAGIAARAGFRPPTIAARLPDCPEDDRPAAPAAALATLAQLLFDPDAALIDEWAALAAAHGVLVDAATAPLLLDWWARQPRRSAHVLAALGARGAWLASLNPEWQPHARPASVPPDAEPLWQLGGSGERLSLLSAVRRADPARARALIESTWDSDSAVDRQRFLETLYEQRSLDDEPFLERALDDRSKTVRRQAAALLAAIPGSQLRARLSTIARTLIGTAPARGSGRRIVLSPPLAFDPAWARDGIEERPPDRLGPRAWWLRQILAAAGLSVWTEHTGMTPSQIVAALAGDDYAADAIHALTRAAAAAGDPAWSAALVPAVVARPPFAPAEVAALVAGLPDDRRDALTLEAASSPSLSPLERWTVLIAGGRRWSAGLSRAALRLLGTQPPAAANDWPLARAIDVASRQVAPAALAEFEEALARIYPGGVPGSALKSLERVRFRAAMHKEFAS